MNRVAIIIDNYNKALELIDKHRNDNILFELRIDLEADLLNLLKYDRIDPNRCIITLRSKDEGGHDETIDRTRIIDEFTEFSTKYIDIEIMRDREPSIKTESSLILSTHDYSTSMIIAAEKFLDKIDLIYQDKVYKFVGKPVDSLDFIDSYELLSRKFNRYIILGIGKNAEISRTCVPQEFVFGATHKGDIIHYEKLLGLKNDSIKIGLLGKSLSHSLSPSIHSYLFNNSGISGHYHILEASDESRAKILVNKLIHLQFLGINVTLPYKSLAVDLADKLSDNVILSNACNTLIFDDNIKAENTDISGFDKFITNNNLDRYETVTIIGAGGAARAVAVSLLNHNMEVTIINRSENRFKEFNKDLLDQVEIRKIDGKLNEADIYINATSLGLLGRSSTELMEIGKALAVIDLSYSTGKTPLQIYLESNDKNMKYFDGKQMLFYQAQDAFNLWNKTELNYNYSDIQEDIF